MATNLWCFFTAAPLETFVGLVFFGQITTLIPAMMQLYWEEPTDTSSNGYTHLILFRKYRTIGTFLGVFSILFGVSAGILYFVISKEIGFRSCPLDRCIAESIRVWPVVSIYIATLLGAVFLGFSFVYRQRALRLMA